jgi:arylsulfatase A-like enzyme
MVNIMDEVVGNLTQAYQAKAGMWDNTLVIFSSDNGGPVDLAENAANNWPRRGGKYSLFEGGINVAAFVSGGLLPTAVRGTTNNGIVHIADWYATLAGLYGVRFRQEFTLEDAIGSHACSLEVRTGV